MFHIQEYMPLVFRNLRERFGITEKVFANSFFIQPKPLEQTGHSGSKFFLTNDGKFWVKTMASEDVEVGVMLCDSSWRFLNFKSKEPSENYGNC